jgi:hypothetical protein
MHTLYQEIIFIPSQKLKFLAPKDTYTIKNHIQWGLQNPIKTCGIKWEVVTQCTILNRVVEMGLDPQIVALTACQTFSKSAIENLNAGFTQQGQQENVQRRSVL